MHIITLTHNYPRFSGDYSGTFIQALSQELSDQEQQVTVLAPYDPAYGKRQMSLETNIPQLKLYQYIWPPRLHRLGYMRSMQSDLALRLDTYILSPFFFVAGIAALWRTVKQNRPDIIHAHWLLPNGFIAAVVSRHLNIPLVISVPGSDAQVARQNPLFRSMARFALNQADLLTANSADLRDSVMELGVAPEKFDLILYGTDPEALRPDDHGVAQLRASLSIPDDAVILLCVGSMVPKKGFDIFLQSLAEPSLQGCSWVAVMVGEGDDKIAWQQLGQHLGIMDRLRWVGSVPTDQIGIYYNLCDILLNPAVRRPVDGLNVCVLDAMSCGKPVVGSDVAGNPLAIIEGETGMMTPEGNAAALAQALTRLIKDRALRQRMGHAARKRIENELGWPHLARRYIKHFERLTIDDF